VHATQNKKAPGKNPIDSGLTEENQKNQRNKKSKSQNGKQNTGETILIEEPSPSKMVEETH